MKPFDLEAAKAGAPLVTRDGRKARFVAYVSEVTEFPVIAYVDDCGETWSFTNEGHWNRCESGRDLFMAPRKRTVWVNLYKSFDSEDAADKHVFGCRLGNRAYPVEIEE